MVFTCAEARMRKGELDGIALKPKQTHACGTHSKLPIATILVCYLVADYKKQWHCMYLSITNPRTWTTHQHYTTTQRAKYRSFSPLVARLDRQAQARVVAGVVAEHRGT